VDRRSFLAIGGGSLAAALARAGLLAQSTTPGATVETRYGRLRGVQDRGVQIFKGVPYGAPTDGARRLVPAVAPTPWTGVRDAADYGPRAFQPFRPMIPEIGDALTGSGPMSEDCLRLNVWTPGVGAGRRPVMVWFHGGGQRTGSGNSIFYDGADLARTQDVVVVTVTHRLNAFAHLWLAGLPGVDSRFSDTANLGLRDLVLALRWVRDHAATFGGDAGNVTIFGQSGGGGKTAMLTALPEARGLFHRAIIMSTLADTAVTGLEPERAIEAAELYLARLGLKPADAGRLQEMPAERLLEALTNGGAAGGQSGRPGPAQDLSLRYVPVVDGKTLPANPFEPASPLSADIPILTGSNECEGIPYANPQDPYWTTTIADDQALHARVKTMLGAGDAETTRLIDLYRSHRPRESRDGLAAIISGDNSQLRLASYLIAEAKFAQQRAPLFLYSFTWRSPVRDGRLRSMHCMELPFAFAHPDLIAFMTGGGEPCRDVAARMSASWAAFARTGNPNHAGVPTWRAWNPTEWPTMVFGTETRAENDPFGEERRAIAAIRASRQRA
jgi:para-nitrobenzyl esterase